MATLTFPTSPIDQQVYAEAGVSYIYVASQGIWRVQAETLTDVPNDITLSGDSLTLNRSGTVIGTAVDLSGKQDNLTAEEQAVVDANAFTSEDEDKLDGLTQYTDALARTAVGPIPTQYTDDLARTAVGTIPTQYTDDLARTAVGTIPSQYTDDLARTATGVSATPTSIMYVDSAGNPQTVNLEAGSVTPHSPRVSISEVNDLDGSNQELTLPRTDITDIDVAVTVGPTNEFTFVSFSGFTANGVNTVATTTGQSFRVTVPANPPETPITVHYTLRYRDEATSIIHSVRRVYTIRIGVVWCFGVANTVPNAQLPTSQGILHLGDTATETSSATARNFWTAVEVSKTAGFQLTSGGVILDLYDSDPDGTPYTNFAIGETMFKQYQVERNAGLGTLTVIVTGV